MKHENGVALIQEIPSIIKHEGQETHSGILDDIRDMFKTRVVVRRPCTQNHGLAVCLPCPGPDPSSK
eukprot:scaffold61446_cov27-Cyclotella_meneghiniana.AAC.1